MNTITQRVVSGWLPGADSWSGREKQSSDSLWRTSGPGMAWDPIDFSSNNSRERPVIVVSRLGLLLAGFLALAGLVGCGSKGKACRLAEQAEVEILQDWREGGLMNEAEAQRGVWATHLEALRQSDQGTAQTIQGFNRQLAAMVLIEEGSIRNLKAQSEDMRAGKRDVEKDGGAMWLMAGSPKDEKTAEQRAAEYAPKIAENERKIMAHQKAAATARKALEKLQGML